MATKTKLPASDLQEYLRKRGVAVGNNKKVELEELYRLSEEVGLEIDPEGYIEDRKEAIESKLIGGDTVLPNPGLVKCDPGISILPTISVFDIWSYLMSKDVPLTSIRDYRRSEAFTLME